MHNSPSSIPPAPSLPNWCSIFPSPQRRDRRHCSIVCFLCTLIFWGCFFWLFFSCLFHFYLLPLCLPTCLCAKGMSQPFHFLLYFIYRHLPLLQVGYFSLTAFFQLVHNIVVVVFFAGQHPESKKSLRAGPW